ncbi:hypothetical protein [Streptomyces sp. NPDC054849]
MRAWRAVTASLLSAMVLAGCGPSASAGGDDAPPRASTEPSGSASGSPGATGGASPDPTPSASPSGPAATTSPSADRLPAPAENLVRVTQSGGFAGRTHTLVVKGDGSWTRLDAKAKPESTGKMSERELAALRTALREADFARLPRISTGGPTIYDGFSYTFVHGGYEVVADQGSLPPALQKVLDALPVFAAG